MKHLPEKKFPLTAKDSINALDLEKPNDDLNEDSYPPPRFVDPRTSWDDDLDEDFWSDPIVELRGALKTALDREKTQFPKMAHVERIMQCFAATPIHHQPPGIEELSTALAHVILLPPPPNIPLSDVIPMDVLSNIVPRDILYGLSLHRLPPHPLPRSHIFPDAPLPPPSPATAPIPPPFPATAPIPPPFPTPSPRARRKWMCWNLTGGNTREGNLVEKNRKRNLLETMKSSPLPSLPPSIHKGKEKVEVLLEHYLWEHSGRKPEGEEEQEKMKRER
ncbi:hypothetical protein SASPL_139683 [Salvia splendens]|uniref:Uncharacterized protein n=1 Tax=Salvia splendens TaxID=180675 RepID=A0A8X8WNE3_SALSN|nr:max-binding protein MNT-like [Salvia splendens]KAG6398228.1 hypothetical protein SASPL_139683 [Salvia splendens]